MAKKWLRHSIQAVATLVQNANFKGFFTGRIYEGASKSVCVPGLNCYSCPGAVGSCPIGSLQSFLGGIKFKFPYYVLGLLIFFGTMTTHGYSMGKNILATLGTILGMVFIMFIAMLFFNLIRRMISFITDVVVEIAYRVK